MDSTTISSVVSAYFIFIPVIEYMLFKTVPKLNIIIAIILVFIGIPLIVGLKAENFQNRRMLFLLLADLTIALNIITIGHFAKGSNPAILGMGQTFFIAIIAYICWIIECRLGKSSMRLPKEPIFWGSAIFIGCFIRAFYTVIQTYAQRYISPVNAALIFSSEIIMTLLFSGFVYRFLFNESYSEVITIPKAIGAMLMLAGILISEIDFTAYIPKKLKEVRAIDND